MYLFLLLFLLIFKSFIGKLTKASTSHLENIIHHINCENNRYNNPPMDKQITDRCVH